MRKAFIELTLAQVGTNQTVLIDPLVIETMYEEKDHTRVAVPTHNNGGWRVKESPAQILEQIRHAGVELTVTDQHPDQAPEVAR